MRKRWLALLCCALLAVATVLPAGAAETVYFTAVNDEVMDLEDATMPFWSGGYLYVPSTVFRDLGVGHSRNTTRGIVTLYDLNDRINNLIFNLNNSTVTDGRGNAYYPAAIQRGNVVFLPAALVAQIFSLRYNGAIRVRWGFLVRMSSASAVLSDAQLADAAVSTMEERYNKYIKSRTPESDVQTPVTDPAVTFSGKRVYLCMAATDAAAVETLLADLDRYSSQAAFYFSPELLESSDDLLRRMTATGQAVGILVDAARTDLTVTEQIRRGNEALWRAAYGKTRLVHLENGGDQALAEVRESGCRVLTADLDRSPYGLRSASAANTLLDRVSSRRGDVTVWLGDGADSVGLRAFLTVARGAEDRCLALTETA